MGGNEGKAWSAVGLRVALIYVTLLSGAAACSWAFIEVMTRFGQAEERRHLAAAVAAAASALDPAQVQALQGGPQDVGTPALEHVRDALVRIRQNDPNVRFAYLMRRLPDGGYVFLADAEPESSRDYSPPGQRYTDQVAGLEEVTRRGQALVEAPYRDRWGTWVSALAPVTDARSGRRVAVLGLDLPEEVWSDSIARYRAFAQGAAALLAGVIALFLVGDWRQRRFAAELGALNQRLETQLAERRRVQEELRLAGEVIAHTGEGVFVVDNQGLIRSINPAFERITGYGEAEAVGKPARWLYLMENTEAPLAELRTQLIATGHWTGEIMSRRKNGERYPMEITISTIRDEAGAPTHFAAIFRDNTAQRALEDRLSEQATIDGLTGIPNRRRFDQALEREWRRAQRERQPLSLLMADLDFFKRYNDLYGHLGGDECLRRVAGVIEREARRPGDVAARYGGEEFALILPNTDAAGAERVAGELNAAVRALGLPHEDSQAAHVVTISVGHATVTPSPNASWDELIAQADRALYRAKQEGRDCVRGADEAARAAPVREDVSRPPGGAASSR